MLIAGDCLEQLKTLDAESIDSLITDPPAGISFMGKGWDSGNNFIPAMTEIFKEVLRVLKPGAHGLVWALPRTSHWTATALENAGFEIRDVVTHLFGSGFPKSHNLGDGRGTALKPASEHWILVRKPLSEKTVAANVLKHSTGGINIDACRIVVSENDPNHRQIANKTTLGTTFGSKDEIKSVSTGTSPLGALGRFPANLVLDEAAAEMLDEQSGFSKSSDKPRNNSARENVSKGKEYERIGYSVHSDSGGASRFFYVAKASKKDRNEGLEGMPLVEKKTLDGGTFTTPGNTATKMGGAQQNFHPTVKSSKLMEYLITLITPPNGIVLDPFMGSGSTGVAAKRLGFQFIGIEKEQEYFEIAERRIGA